MSTGFDDDTVEIFSPQKSKEIVAEFAEMADLSSFDESPGRLARLLDAMEQLDTVPPHMDQYTLDQLHQAAEMVRYIKISNRNHYTGLLDDLDLLFDGTDDDDSDAWYADSDDDDGII